MFRYTWKKAWWPVGLSIWSLAIRFAHINHASPLAVIRLLSRDDKTLGSSFPIDDSQLSKLGLCTIGRRLGAAEENLLTAFPQDICPTQSSRELSPHLRYCVQCLEEGAHFSWQQLRWLTRCPIHDQEIREKCFCDRSIRYRLTAASLDSGSFCTCGALTLNSRAAPADRSLLLLESFLSQLSVFRAQLGLGFVFMRTDRGTPNEVERSRAVCLVEQLLSLHLKPAELMASSKLRDQTTVDVSETRPNIDPILSELHQALASDCLDWRAQRIVQYVADEILETWSNDSIVKAVRGHLMYDGNIELIDKPDLTFIACRALVLKTFTQLERARLPQTDKRGNSLLEAIRNHGGPLCVVRRKAPNSEMGIRRYESIYNYWETELTSELPAWIDDFIQYLVDEFYPWDIRPSVSQAEGVLGPKM